jgi:LysM repeat protein
MLQKLGLFFISLLAFFGILFILATGKITVPPRAAGAAQAAPVVAQPAPQAAATVAVQKQPQQPQPQQQQPQAAPAAVLPAPQYVPPSGDGAPYGNGPSDEGDTVYYTVKPGDTLFRIAVRFGTSVAALQRANNLHGTIIYPGQKLCIFTAPARPNGPGHEAGKPIQSSTYGPWYAQYFNNGNWEGTPGFVRYDNNINFDWGFGTPNASVVQADNFSVRWTLNKWMATGVYTFHLKYDDGLRLVVNDVEVFNDTGNNGLREVGFAIPIDKPQTVIRAEYVERGEKAQVHVWFGRLTGALSPPVPSWKADFYNSTDLTGPVIWSTNTREIKFNWGGGSPRPGLVSIDYFAARFSRQEYFVTGKYRWVARVKDGVRILLDGQNIMEQWRAQPQTTFVGNDIDLGAGYHSIVVEYQHYQENASLEVYMEKR